MTIGLTIGILRRQRSGMQHWRKEKEKIRLLKESPYVTCITFTFDPQFWTLWSHDIAYAHTYIQSSTDIKQGRNQYKC